MTNEVKPRHERADWVLLVNAMLGSGEGVLKRRAVAMAFDLRDDTGGGERL